MNRDRPRPPMDDMPLTRSSFGTARPRGPPPRSNDFDRDRRRDRDRPSHPQGSPELTRAGFGSRTQSRPSNSSMGMGRSRPNNFADRRNDRDRDDDRVIGRESFGTRVGEPPSRSSFGGGGSAFGRANSDRYLPSEPAPPRAPPPPVKIAVPGSDGFSWASKKPAESAAKKSSGGGFGRRKKAAEPASSGGAFGRASKNPFSGSGSGFGATLLKTIGKPGNDFGSPRTTFSPRGSGAGFGSDLKEIKLDGGSEKKSSRLNGSTAHPAPVTAKISAFPAPKDIFNTTKYEGMKKIAVAPPAAERRAEALRKKEEREREKKKKREEQRAKREFDAKEAQKLMDAVTPQSGTYRNPISIAPFNKGVLKLDLEDEQILSDLCHVLGVSIFGGTIELMTLVNKIRKTKRFEAEFKEKLIVGVLKSMHQQKGEVVVYDFLSKSLANILEILGAPPIDGDIAALKSHLTELDLLFLLPKINVADKLQEVFAANGSPDAISKVLSLCEGKIDTEYAYMVLDHVLGGFFKGDGAAKDFLGKDVLSLITTITDSTENKNDFMYVVVSQWYECGKGQDVAQFFRVLMEVAFISDEELLAWRDSVTSDKRFKKGKTESLFKLMDLFEEVDKTLKKALHGNPEEDEYVSAEEYESSDEPVDDYLGSLMNPGAVDDAGIEDDYDF